MKTNKENPPQYEWGPFPFGDGRRILDIRYDPVFKAVFTRDTAESRAALSDLISALIGRSVTVETLITNEPPVDDLRQRYLRFDVACKTGKGEPVNVEDDQRGTMGGIFSIFDKSREKGYNNRDNQP